MNQRFHQSIPRDGSKKTEGSVFIWNRNGMWPMTGIRTKASGSGSTVPAMRCGITGIFIKIIGIILGWILQWLRAFSLSKESRITLTGMGRWQSLGHGLWYRWTKTAYCIFRKKNPRRFPLVREEYRWKMETAGSRNIHHLAKQKEKTLRWQRTRAANIRLVQCSLRSQRQEPLQKQTVKRDMPRENEGYRMQVSA